MDAHRPPRYGYSYQKAARPHRHQDEQHDDGATASQRRFRLFGLEWRIQPLYEQAGCPFGKSDVGLLLWVEFGRRTHSN